MITPSLVASVVFYTCLPVPFAENTENLNFQRIARFAPLVGLLIGLILGIVDWGLIRVTMPEVVRTAVIVVVWLGVTGGLHMDGAMDTADGLAVMDPQRRLMVMADSRTGAFGVMVAIAILLLKFAGVFTLLSSYFSRGVLKTSLFSTLVLMTVAGWGRWAQVLAIERYAYLKPEGKGAFHKKYFCSPWDWLLGLVTLLGLAGIQVWLMPPEWPIAVAELVGGGTIAFCTGAWFNHQLGGHTGDTYGAVVEWTEALLLCWLTCFIQ